MATFEITIDDTKIQGLLQSDQGLSALLGPILNQVLDAEMAEHLQAAPQYQPDIGGAIETEERIIDTFYHRCTNARFRSVPDEYEQRRSVTRPLPIIFNRRLCVRWAPDIFSLFRCKIHNQ